MNLDMQHLIRRAQKGDALAFASLHNRYYGAIYQYYFYRVGSSRYAADRTSDLFIRMTDRIGFYKPERETFLPWLYTLARSLLMEDLMARGVPYRQALTAAPVLTADTQPADSSLPEQLRESLGALSADERDIIIGRLIEHRTLRDIAREVGHTAGVVRGLQLSALRKLTANTAGEADS
ncbi:sigma-70 family RNA polymerase sigma factor [bacterium]|nr:sigma-70 family RNA polymerase sigma factor [bacterium]